MSAETKMYLLVFSIIMVLFNLGCLIVFHGFSAFLYGASLFFLGIGMCSLVWSHYISIMEDWVI